MNSRITFGAQLRYAMQVRALSLTDVARQSGVAVATASSAAMGRPVNVNTALRIARAVAGRPIVPELLEWVERPKSSELATPEREAASSAPTPGAGGTIYGGTRIRDEGRRRSEPHASAQLRLAVDGQLRSEPHASAQLRLAVDGQLRSAP
jgi:transcriptional regulator with XRE-family HTH domain